MYSATILQCPLEFISERAIYFQLNFGIVDKNIYYQAKLAKTAGNDHEADFGNLSQFKGCLRKIVRSFD